MPYGLPGVPWGSWALVKSPRPPADPAHMLAASLSTDVWLGVIFIAAITVLACLVVISNMLRYELEFIRLVAGAKELRDKMIQASDKPEAPDSNVANPATGRPGMIGSPAPMAASAESAETEAIVDSPPESESEPNAEPDADADADPAATDAAQAA